MRPGPTRIASATWAGPSESSDGATLPPGRASPTPLEAWQEAQLRR